MDLLTDRRNRKAMEAWLRERLGPEPSLWQRFKESATEAAITTNTALAGLVGIATYVAMIAWGGFLGLMLGWMPAYIATVIAFFALPFLLAGAAFIAVIVALITSGY